MVSVGRFVGAKVVLIFIAIAMTRLVGHRVAHLDLLLAAWLTLTLAIGGPLNHHRLLIEVPGEPRGPYRARLRHSRRGKSGSHAPPDNTSASCRF